MLTNEIIAQYLHGECSNLALELHNRTGLPIYGIYDQLEEPHIWGKKYYHYFIKVNEDSYLDVQGLNSAQNLVDYWAIAGDDSVLKENLKIEQAPLYDEPISDLTKQITTTLMRTYQL